MGWSLPDGNEFFAFGYPRSALLYLELHVRLTGQTQIL